MHGCRRAPGSLCCYCCCCCRWASPSRSSGCLAGDRGWHWVASPMCCSINPCSINPCSRRLAWAGSPPGVCSHLPAAEWQSGDSLCWGWTRGSERHIQPRQGSWARSPALLVLSASAQLGLSGKLTNRATKPEFSTLENSFTRSVFS